jgi:hypothetical protein
LSDVLPGGTWSSTNGAVATISSTGVVTGLSGGVTTISYTIPTTGCAATRILPVIALQPIVNAHDFCAWGDTLHISNSDAGGIYTSSLATVDNVGGGNGILTSHAPGTATVTYTVPAGCSVTSVLTVNALPATISGNYRLCTGLTTTLTDAVAGGSWTSDNTAVALAASGTGLITGVTAGTAVIRYTLPTGCYTDTTVYVNTPPTAISGVSGICAGTPTTLTDAITGGDWSSSNPSVASIATGSGVMTGLSAGTATITYTMGASCIATKDVTINAAPTAYITTGGGSYCSGGTGVHVLLSGSQPGVSYQLYNGTTAVGSAVSGTGTVVDFGLQTAPGSYSVIATNSSTLCSASMVGAATVNTTPLPFAYTVTGGGNYCAGSGGVHIGLSGSATGISYQLYLGTTPSGLPVSGTGSSLDFGLRTAAGSYTVAATNSSTSCTSTMTGAVTTGVTAIVIPSVTLTPLPGDTVCAGQTATFTTATVNGGTLPAYQWKVNGVNAGTGSPSYTYAPANGDIVSVTLTSNAACATPDTNSSRVTMTVATTPVPTVAISAAPGTTITKGTTVVFTATVTNGGLTPAYQWNVNGTPQSGATAPTYTTSTLVNGDVVSCVVTGSSACGIQDGNGQVMMTVMSGVGVQPLTNASELAVLPNPNKGTFVITGTLAGSATEELQLEVTDMLGQVVYRGQATATGGKVHESISLGKVANGMYILNLHTGSDNKVFHLVVEQ